VASEEVLATGFTCHSERSRKTRIAAFGVVKNPVNCGRPLGLQTARGLLIVENFTGNNLLTGFFTTLELPPAIRAPFRMTWWGRLLAAELFSFFSHFTKS